MKSNFVTHWINDITTSLRKCVARFPAAVLFVNALTAWCIYLINEGGSDNERFISVFTYYLSVGIPMSLVLQLWSEEMTNRVQRIITHSIGQLLLLGDAIFLYQLKYISLTINIAHAAAIFALIVAVFLISFLKGNNDVPCWNFAMRSAIACFKAIIVSLLLTFGINLLIFSIDVLFDVDINDTLYFDICIVSNVGFCLLYFIGMLPRGTIKHDQLPRANKFLGILVNYIFMPFTAVYMLVLYTYAGRILILWELPNGYVSWLVTVLMIGCVIIETGLYPLRQFPVKHKAHELIARWLPILIIPLLVLMTIGIIRRFNDYGITVARLYLAAFNLWCYIVCIVLFITRARRISWIPASFAAMFLLTSVLPKFNFSNITLEALLGKIEETMRSTCTDTPPLSQEQYTKWITETLPIDEGQRINDKFIYLQDMYDIRNYSHLVTDDVYFYGFGIVDTVAVYDDYDRSFSFYPTLTDGVEIPNGATHIAEIQLDDYSNPTFVFHKNEQLLVGLNHNDTISIDLPTLNELNNCNSPYTGLLQNNKNFKFVLTSLDGYAINDSINITQIYGYLFQLNKYKNEQATTDR